MAARQLCGLAKALGGGKAPCPPLPIGPAPAPRPLLPHPWARRAAVGGSSAARVQTTRFRVPATSRRSFCGASAAEAGAPAAAAAAAARLRVGLGPGVPRIAGGGGQSWGWHRMASSSGRTPGQPNPLRAGDGAKSAERSTSTATSPPPRTYTVSPVSAAIVRKRVRAMEDAGVIKPGALSYQVRVCAPWQCPIRPPPCPPPATKQPGRSIATIPSQSENPEAPIPVAPSGTKTLSPWLGLGVIADRMVGGSGAPTGKKAI